jgi:hypothetical protein
MFAVAGGITKTFVPIFKDNEITNNSFTSSYLLEGGDLTSLLPAGIVFTGNKITATGTNRPIKISGEYGTINNNVIRAKTTSDWFLYNTGQNNVLTGNVGQYGAIRLGSSGNVCVGNKATISDAGGNTVASNG